MTMIDVYVLHVNLQNTVNVQKKRCVLPFVCLRSNTVQIIEGGCFLRFPSVVWFLKSINTVSVFPICTKSIYLSKNLL